MTDIILWYIVVMYSIGIPATLLQVGKPRKPTTPGFAVAVTVLSGPILVMAMLILFGGK